VPQRTSDRFVFVAGRVGITPMLSMLRTLADCGDTRPVLLVVAGCTADDRTHPHRALRRRLSALGTPPTLSP
jgi:ferredoxin-NADP reductase